MAIESFLAANGDGTMSESEGSLEGPLQAPPANMDAGGARGYSAGRSKGSRPRSRPNEREVFAVQARRALSARKERRWMNDRRIGAISQGRALNEMDLGVNGNWAAYDRDSGLFDVAAASRLLYAQEYRSVFEGFTDEMCQDFLNCEGGFSSAGAQPKSPENQLQQPLTAEIRFLKVSSNLRKHLVKTGTREPFSSFLKDLEEFIFECFEEFCKDENTTSFPKTPITVSGTLLGEPERGLRKPDQTTPSIDLIFKSGLYRLLTHGLCQFHGLSSKSFDVNGEDGQKQRVLQISWTLGGWTSLEVEGDDGEIHIDDRLSKEKECKVMDFLQEVNANQIF